MPKIPQQEQRRYEIYNESCFDTFKRLESGSVDMVMCDPPYGTTACKWDSVIPLTRMWMELKRVVKRNSAILLMSSQPFTSLLVYSQIDCFKYRWIWEKTRPGNIANAKLMPLKNTEEILVFSHASTANGCRDVMNYFPQGLEAVNRVVRQSTSSEPTAYARPNLPDKFVQEQTNYPREIIRFGNNERGLHPTQKPVALMEYLIKTYTRENELVLDFAMGSGTTGVATGNLNRRFIGCDNDTEFGYFAIAERRIREAYAKNTK